MWDQPGVHDIYRDWRRSPTRTPEGEDADRILCAEAWVLPAEALARYVRPDELHQSFNFQYLMTPWLAADQRADDHAVARAGRGASAPRRRGCCRTTTSSATRRGSGYPQQPGLQGSTASARDDPQPDAVARAASRPRRHRP